MKFLSEQELANFQTIEQDVNKLVYLKLVAIGPNTLNKEQRDVGRLLTLIKSIGGHICLPTDKEELKGEVCRMIDKLYEQ